MQPRLKQRWRERGQATVETLLMFPLVIGVLFLGLAIAVLWHAQALSAQLALEGIVRDSVAPGSGVGFVQAKKAQAAQSFSIGPLTQQDSAGIEGENTIFTMQGRATIPWAPFGLDLSTVIRATVISPVWKFMP